MTSFVMRARLSLSRARTRAPTENNIQPLGRTKSKQTSERKKIYAK